MKYISTFNLLVLTVLLTACNNMKPEKAMEQKAETAFPKGEKITNNNFTGTAWLQMLVNNDSTYTTSIGNVLSNPVPEQTGTSIPVVKFCWLPKAKVIIRKKASQPNLFKKEMWSEYRPTQNIGTVRRPTMDLHTLR